MITLEQVRDLRASVHGGISRQEYLDLLELAEQALAEQGWRMPAAEGDYQRVYAEFWKSLVETDGKLDPDKVARELFDFHQMMREVSEVYDSVTVGRFSKPNTAARHIIGAVGDVTDEAIGEALAEAKDSEVDPPKVQPESEPQS